MSGSKHWKQAWRRFAWAAVLIVSSGLSALAQAIPVWPEIDTYIKLDDKIRLYDSRYSKWSRTELQAGSSFPVTRRWELESYFDYINDSSGSPTRQTKALGIVTTLYFWPWNETPH